MEINRSYLLFVLLLQCVVFLFAVRLLPQLAVPVAWPIFYVWLGWRLFSVFGMPHRRDRPATGATPVMSTPPRRRRTPGTQPATPSLLELEESAMRAQVSSQLLPPSEHAAAFHAAVGGPLPLHLAYKQLEDPATVTFAPATLVLRRPLSLVATALARKYKLGPRVTPADALHPPVQSIDELGKRESVYSGASVLWRAERIRFSLEEVPALVRHFAGVAHLDVLVDTELHFASDDGAAAAAGVTTPAPIALLSFARNGNATGIATFQEVSSYTRHPERPDEWTLYVSRVEACAASWAGRRLLSLAGSSTAELIATHLEQLQARMDELAPQSSVEPLVATAASRVMEAAAT